MHMNPERAVVKSRNFHKIAKNHMDHALNLMVPKFAMRGPENITEQGLYGVATRLVKDKGNRILAHAKKADLRERLLEYGIDPDTLAPLRSSDDEHPDTVADDLYDAIGYSIIALMILEGSWGNDLYLHVPGNTGHPGYIFEGREHRYKCTCMLCTNQRIKEQSPSTPHPPNPEDMNGAADVIGTDYNPNGRIPEDGNVE